MENLEQQREENSKKINTTEYKMSIGEIVNLYKDKEIIIDPDFQRLFRWNLRQKSRLIESILIGIPLPSIFIQQRNDGVWDVIDGLQRLSTILEFVGVLQINGKQQEKTTLEKTNLLPALEGKTYGNFNKDIQLIFKRFALSLVILKNESDEEAKYELFDRLNSGGSVATAQEIRQAIYRHKKKDAVELIEKLSENEIFQRLISVSKRRTKEGYDKELVLRFFAYSDCPDKFNDYGGSVKTFLDKYLLDGFKKMNLIEYEDKFVKFFDLLGSINTNKSLFHGKNGFSIAKYEAIVLGLSYNESPITDINIIKEKVLSVDSQEWFIKSITTNSFARKRLTLYLDDKGTINFFSNS